MGSHRLRDDARLPVARTNGRRRSRDRLNEAIVVLRPLGLGDFLTGVPAYRAIARAFPEERRTLLAPRALHALVPLLGGAFTGALDVAPLAALPPAARDAGVAIDLHGRGPESQRVLLAARPRRLVSFAHDAVAESRDGAAWRAEEHEVRRWCRMLDHAGIPADPTELAIDVPRARRPNDGSTILHPGAASESRRWPVDRWIAVARTLAERGERLALTGGDSEAARCDTIARACGSADVAVYAGTTGLVELAALVAHARRVVCTDTGVAHVASAYGTPSVVLFGPTPPAHWGPPARARHRVVWTGRRGDPHADDVDAGLLAITPERVIAEIDALDGVGATL